MKSSPEGSSSVPSTSACLTLKWPSTSRPIASFPAFRHPLTLHAAGFAWVTRKAQAANGARDAGAGRKPRPSESALDQQDQVPAALPELLGLGNVQATVVGVHAAVSADAVRVLHVLGGNHPQTAVPQRGQRETGIAIAVQLPKLTILRSVRNDEPCCSTSSSLSLAVVIEPNAERIAERPDNSASRVGSNCFSRPPSPSLLRDR